jgi:hypothetical protein
MRPSSFSCLHFRLVCFIIIINATGALKKLTVTMAKAPHHLKVGTNSGASVVVMEKVVGVVIVEFVVKIVVNVMSIDRSL